MARAIYLRIMLWLAALIGLGVAVIFLFGRPILPKCGGDETLSLVRDLAVSRLPAEMAGRRGDIVVSGVSEISFDSERQVRRCEAVLDLEAGGARPLSARRISYALDWQDRDAGRFQIVVDGL